MAPRLGWQALLDLSAGLGCIGVEFRSDLPGKLFGGTDPAVVRAAAAAKGQHIVGLAQLCLFNDWSDARRSEAEALMGIASALGAEGLALARGEAVDPKVYVPFLLVAPANVADFAPRN